MLPCAAYAHRKQLNLKIELPDNVKKALRNPRDEVSMPKLELLCEAVRREIEGETTVYLRTGRHIEDLARAVERCRSEGFADEVGQGSEDVPVGARLLVDVDESLPKEVGRHAVAELVRSMREGEPLRVRMRPLRTSREPPLDSFARELMQKPYRSCRELTGVRAIEEMRDRLLICLWDALFLTDCARWTADGVANTGPSDALELGYWFHRGQQNSKRSLFEGLCVIWGAHGRPGKRGVILSWHMQTCS